MIVFEFQWHMLLTLLASTVFPLLVGLVTTRETHAGRKAIFLAAINVVAPVLAEMANALATQTPYDLGLATFAALTGFLVSVGMHYGLWRHTGATDFVATHGVTPKHRA